MRSSRALVAMLGLCSMSGLNVWAQCLDSMSGLNVWIALPCILQELVDFSKDCVSLKDKSYVLHLIYFVRYSELEVKIFFKLKSLLEQYSNAV